MTPRPRDQILNRLKEKKGGRMSGTLPSLIWELHLACSAEQFWSELDHLVQSGKIRWQYLDQTRGHIEITLRRSRKGRRRKRRKA